MSKYRPYSRRQLRTLFRDWIGANRRALLMIVLGAAVVLVIQILLLTGLSDSPRRSYLLGFAHALTLAALAGIVVLAFFAHSPAAIRQLRGAWGEDNTRDELKRAKRKRLIWGSIDGVDLQLGDIDHLVVTRRGGLIAIDSKWRAESFTDVDQMTRAAAKVRIRSEALARTVMDRARGTHRATTNPLQVRSVIVLWGTSQHTIPDDAHRDSIDFIAGNNLVAWLARLDGEQIDKHAAMELLEKIKGFRAGAWNQGEVSRR